jgi:hypothetical protein
MEADSCGLITQKQLFDFVRGGNRDGSREQMFAPANIASEHRFADQPQGESCIVAEDLPVEWRIAIEEFDREAELVCIESQELLMFATKSCAETHLRMGRGVVCLGSSLMASALFFS